MHIRTYAQPKEGKAISEDFFFYEKRDRDLIVCVGDWASSLYGQQFKHAEIASSLDLSEDTLLPGGVLGAQTAKHVVQHSEQRGTVLIEEINAGLQELYAKIDHSIPSRSHTFTGYITHLHITPGKTHLTSVGDVFASGGGTIIAGFTKKIDLLYADIRKSMLMQGATEDEVQAFLFPLLEKQFTYQNTTGNTFSYPAIDGTTTTAVLERTFPTPNRLLLWTDGYETPAIHTIEGLEAQLVKVYKEDPRRCNQWPAVKIGDDRTAVEIDLSDFDEFSEEVYSA